MDTFVWDQNFVTGLADVDDQHKGLLDLFNQLSESLFAGDADQPDRVLEATFDRLLAYTEFHFSDEEQLMAAAGVDPRHIRAHEALHRQFVQQVLDMWSRRATMASPAEAFAGFLTSWLGLHILGIDQSLARQIAAIQDGIPADEAYEREQAGHDNSTQALLKLISRLYHVLSVQNAELQAVNAGLEERVRERTDALEHANRELLQANARLEAYSRTDGLLQIANRGYFDDQLLRASASAFRREQPLGMLLIDVDHFKAYNDTYGHQAGDACLQAVARAVSRALPRITDVVARYGGEELAVILPETGMDGTAAVAKRVVEAVAAMQLPHKGSDVAAYVTVSVGAVSQVPHQQNVTTALVAEADAALYRAKMAGRNCWLIAPAL